MTQIDLLQNFIDSANATIYLKDDEGRLLMVNRACAETFKRTKEEMIGKTDYDFAPKEAADEFRLNDRQVIEAGKPMTFKTTFTSPSGTLTVLDHKFPVLNVAGSPKAVGGIAIIIETT